MKVKMKIGIAGNSDGYHDLKRGDIVDFDQATAEKYLTHGYAQADLTGPLRQPRKREEIPNW